MALSTSATSSISAVLFRPRRSRRVACRASPPSESGAPRQQLSPGAGLPTAEEQAEAAFLDILETSKEYGPQTDATRQDMDTVKDLASGATDDKWKKAKSRGVVCDLLSLFGALSGGAHIVRQDDVLLVNSFCANLMTAPPSLENFPSGVVVLAFIRRRKLADSS